MGLESLCCAEPTQRALCVLQRGLWSDYLNVMLVDNDYSGLFYSCFDSLDSRYALLRPQILSSARWCLAAPASGGLGIHCERQQRRSARHRQRERGAHSRPGTRANNRNLALVPEESNPA